MDSIICYFSLFFLLVRVFDSSHSLMEWIYETITAEHKIIIYIKPTLLHWLLHKQPQSTVNLVHLATLRFTWPTFGLMPNVCNSHRCIARNLCMLICRFGDVQMCCIYRNASPEKTTTWSIYFVGGRHTLPFNPTTDTHTIISTRNI